MTVKEKRILQESINIEIGRKVFGLLGLKISKIGRIDTSYGTKTIQGLGAVISRIVRESTQEVTEFHKV